MDHLTQKYDGRKLGVTPITDFSTAKNGKKPSVSPATLMHMSPKADKTSNNKIISGFAHQSQSIVSGYGYLKDTGQYQNSPSDLKEKDLSKNAKNSSNQYIGVTEIDPREIN